MTSRSHNPRGKRSYDSVVADAVRDANIPTLLMVLVQLTGELRWLDDPYRPTRGKGLSENDTGGLPDTVQDDIRQAAADAICRWHDGEPVAIPEPDEALMTRMLSVAMGEEVPAEYGPMILDDLRAAGPAAPAETAPFAPAPGYSAIVIGAGISGMLAARQLRNVGVDCTVLERNPSVGGCWFNNHYPGCGVDVPSYLYSFSTDIADWPHYYASRDELHQYLEGIADKWYLRECIRFSTTVTSARWDEGRQLWIVDVVRPDGTREVLHSNILISAVGAFGKPKLPDLPGMDRFEGRTCHTATWPDDLDVSGKRVGVIGNGASAMQVVPSVADKAQTLTLFQRSAHWVAPFEKFRTPVPESVRFLLQEVPLYRSWYRQRLAWTLNDKLYSALQRDPAWPHPERSINAINDGHRKFFTRYIESELDGRPDLIEKVTPNYPPFGKRILLDNGWYRTLTRDHVELVTDSIAEITPKGVRLADGREVELDVLVFATGFDVVNFLSSFELTGRSGRSLREVWDGDDARAYLGTTVPDFPNMFCLYGPNTQAGHGGSLIFYLECQMRYVISLLGKMFQAGATVVDCLPEVNDKYNDDVDAAHQRMIWTHPGVHSYYQNSRGRVVVSNPWRVVDWWTMTNDANLSDYRLQKPVDERQEAIR
ncbi:NAD(P)/FAD-dependent oxidoreductase [Rhodococcus artemisiae]|uniref:NAD(P)-binding domain-containing protein n=1 Tax=Rhodococcus artemisiae TaxID=714159 RepID=A0ABU7LKE6_9NOCA|nr:NAD(P)-binding protein [Rhodococcus artemisiae]MEE2062010.1 NAD(P)-binding domain-containing protein [Rhodococcus artemisiae]